MRYIFALFRINSEQPGVFESTFESSRAPQWSARGVVENRRVFCKIQYNIYRRVSGTLFDEFDRT